MPRLLLTLVFGLSMAAALAGCATQRTCAVSHTTESPPLAPGPVETRPDRGRLLVDVSAVGDFDAVNQKLGAMPAVSQYRVLRADDVRSLAAANAPLAKLYEQEGRAAIAASGRRTCRSATVLSNLMSHRAAQERNKAAASALELYYSLAEAELRGELLERGLAELDAAAEHLAALKGSGLKLPAAIDETSIPRNRLDLLDKQVQLRDAWRRMQSQLRLLCGFEEDQSMPIWPDADLIVKIEPVDVEAAVVEGLANRPDLAALAELDGQLDADSLPAVRSALGPGLGASIVAKHLLGRQSTEAAEASARQGQLSVARQSLQLAAATEIRQAAWNIETQLHRIALARQQLELSKHRLAELEERHAADGVTIFDVCTARLEALQAEGELVHCIAAWRIAQAKLLAAQGLAAR